VIAYLGLGSNLGDRSATIERAVAQMREIDPHLVCSPIYETAPVGGPQGQGAYLNAVVRLDSALGPRELLELAQRLETEAGRVRAERWGPRTLDVDILLVDDLVIDEVDLVVPHPRLAERAFVLAPLEDLDPDVVPADWRDALGGPEAVGRAIRRYAGKRQ
jgi:2-amino-4-hydroxy-6-hydroxymethyldihydropteridine diphosphokinase